MNDDRHAYGKTLGRNISGARGREQLSQDAVAARMTALGFKWKQQTVAATEKAGRQVTALEIFGLSLALEVSIATLTAPVDEDEVVTLPSGEAVSAASVRRSARGETRGAVRWNGNVPVFPPVNPAGWWMGPEAIEEDGLQPVVAAESHDDHRTGPERPGAAS